jgi:surfeit locus 1 family protein
MYFRPSIKLTLVLLALTVVFFRLGLWQWDRKAEKVLLFDSFENAPVRTIGQALSSTAPFVRVEAEGHYDPVRHTLLDNRIFKGRAGIHVLTPFTLPDGRNVLVNRGWLPLAADRRSLPEFDTAPTKQRISGILTRPVTGGHRVGDADKLVQDQWPQLMTYLDLDSIGAATEKSLEPWVLLLDATDESGFEDRQWRAAVMEPKMHSAYALQWFSLAAAAVVIWLVLGVRRARQINGTEL